MPIPFIIAGVALAAGAYGAKKGYDAKCDFDDARAINQEAKDMYEEAQAELNAIRENTNSQMEQLGALKINIYKKSLTDFVEIFSEIKNIDFEDNLHLFLELGDTEFKNILEIKNDVLKINEVIGGATAALGGGALAGFGAFGGAGMLATASTGTAIGSLSGVAATNATLAWFGGGSLAAGGFGMAGGMAVLGGIVAGPVLAVAGGMMAAKAETAKYEAISNYDKALAAIEEIEIARVAVDGISKRVVEFIEVLEPLQTIFEDYLDNLEEIVDSGNDYSQYTNDDKQIVMITVSIAQTLKNICDVPIIDENGEITRKSKRVLKKAQEFIQKLEEI